MSVRFADETLFLEGACQAADAEPMLSALLENPALSVDLSGAAQLHSAVIQLLLALRPRLIGAPADPFQAVHILPILDVLDCSA